jgi:phage tail sheath protein FI
VAPANEVLRGVVALAGEAPPSRWGDLQERQVNFLRRHPRGFLVMSADTLAHDEDLRPLNVRRLLVLLRRLATSRGATYVFEPNDDSFRRMVQRGFEATLGDLFQRGAFAGRTAATAFQVVTGESLNTPVSVENGRFLVELRVAPSRPMAFLTLRLVQTGERIAVIGA